MTNEKARRRGAMTIAVAILFLTTALFVATPSASASAPSSPLPVPTNVYVPPVAGGLAPIAPAGCGTPLYNYTINVWNNHTIASPEFQFMITFDPATTPGFTSGLSNLAFATANGATIPAWVESGAAAGSTFARVWLRIPAIAPSNETQFYMFDCAVSMMSVSGPTGEAPQLSATYGALDDGATVFNAYYNFSGTTLPTAFVASSTMTGDYSVNNGFSATGVGGSGANISTSATFGGLAVGFPVVDALETPMVGSNWFGSAGFGYSMWSGGGHCKAIGFQAYGANAPPNGVGDVCSVATGTATANLGLTADTVYTSTAQPGGPYADFYENYSHEANLSAATYPALPLQMNLITSGAPVVTFAHPFTVTWIRERTAFAQVGSASAISEPNYTIDITPLATGPSSPAAVYLDNATSTTVTATWTGSTASGVLGYNASVYSGLTCAGTALSTVAVTLPAKLTATFSGLTASTAYSVGVTARNASGTSVKTCGASHNGVGDTTAPFAGWNYWFRNTTTTNVTLAGVAGNREFFTARNGFVTPVIANSSPTSLRKPVVFYENLTGYLRVENVSTLVSTVLPGQTRTWVNNTTGFVGLNAQAPTLMPVISPSNEVTALFDCLDYSGSLYGEVYWLGNSTEQFVDASGVPAQSTTPSSCGIEPGGWFWLMNDSSTQVTVVNMWSHVVVKSPIVAGTVIVPGNSANYIPIVNQIIVSQNNASAHTVLIRSFQFDTATETFNATATVSSPAASFITGADNNNLNFYYMPNGSGVTLYGMGANDATSTTYNLLTANFGATPSATVISGLKYTGVIGTTDTTNVALPAPYNFSLNGATGTSGGAGAQQAPLIDPIHNTSVWDLGTSSSASWFNSEFATCLAFCVTSPVASMWSFVRGTWGTSRIAQDAIITPTGTGSGGGTVLLYTSALGTKVTTTPLTPQPPSGLATSAISYTTATLTWIQSPGGGIVNNTIYRYVGSGCSGTVKTISTSVATTNHAFSGLTEATTYSVTVTAWNATGQSAPSECFSFTTLSNPVPPPPTGFAVSGVSYFNATFTWVQSTGGGIVNNTIYVFNNTVCSGRVTAFQTGINHGTVEDIAAFNPATTYAAYVTSWNATGQSAPSTCLTFTTVATVVIPPLPTQSFEWVWILLLLAAVPIVTTLLYKMGQRGAGFIGGASRRKKRGGGRGGSFRETFSGGGGGFGGASERLRDATRGVGERLGDATSGARDRIARARYGLERRRRGR